MTSFAHVEARLRAPTASEPPDCAAPRPPTADEPSHAHGVQAVDAPPCESLLQIARKVLALLSASQRRRLLWLLPLMVAMAFAQVAGIASIAPFLAVLADPELIQSNRVLAWLNTALGFASAKGFVLFLGAAVLIVLTLSNVFSMGATWVMLRVTDTMRHALARRLLVSYLLRPYLFFTGRNCADLSKSILLEVNEVCNGVLQPLMQLCAKIAVVVFALALLVAADPLLAAVVTAALGGLYGMLFICVRRRLASLGEQRLQASRQRFKVTGEALGGIKEVKLLGRESEFAERFSRASDELSRCRVKQQVIMQVPGHAVETIAFGGILLIILLLLGVKEDYSSAVPLLGLYAFASYRLMPAFQGIFAALTSVRAHAAAVNMLYEDLRGQPAEQAFADRGSIGGLPLRRRLELREIGFRYPEGKGALFKDLSLAIPANSSAAFVGATGSGKSTLVDLILGLLEPQKGQVLVDGVALTQANRPAWQTQIGYVPQHIYLFDEAIAQNIAFGLPRERIDMAAVERAARAAHLHDFIVNELPQGYETMVGERGIRLSGGQRQRVGIARALYHDPAILVLDEATSALDGATEQAIMDAVSSVSGTRTLIMIAHRLTTVQECDAIFVLEKGRIIARGTSDELLANCPQYRAMARRKEPARAAV